MKISNIKLQDIERKVVYHYTNEENTEIKEIKFKENIVPENSGYFLITGKIKIADGSTYPAIFGISSDYSGELFEAYFLVNGKWVSQEDKNFLKKLGKKKSQVFPYKYHLNVKVGGDVNLSQQF